MLTKKKEHQIRETTAANTFGGKGVNIHTFKKVFGGQDITAPHLHRVKQSKQTILCSSNLYHCKTDAGQVFLASMVFIIPHF